MLVFDSIKHTYCNAETGAEYISATTLLSKYKKLFDAVKASERVAKREGCTPEEIRLKWKSLNDESKKFGTKIHKIIENYNLTKIVDKEYAPLIESYKNTGIIDAEDDLLVEKQLYSHHFRVAGTADIIRKEEKGSFSVFDIKTNKKFNLYSQYNEKLLYPVDHLQSCEYANYSLQLSLYAFMYEEMTGQNLNQLGILYYDKEAKSFSYYPVIYLKTDILMILQHYKSKRHE
jgi:aldehyde:ferredoxin oxidoreductase